jgi:formamidopyrimidine-DNA glycosylase
VPELPDIEAYVAALRPRVGGQVVERVRIFSPFLVRTVEPPVEELTRRRVDSVERLAKRIVLAFEGDTYAVLHLMIAGRLLWKPPAAKPPGKIGLAAFDFATGTLLWTEASPKKRASLHLVTGAPGLREHDPGGLEVLECTLADFAVRLRCENHTLKRSLTDPRLFSGIGNAYSDEILHAAGLSPVMLTSRATDEHVQRLFDATRDVLASWRDRLCARFATKFPGQGEITAFRPEFAVHGKFEQPCSACGTPVQRIRYAENECNYCPKCQTGGKVLADRSLSRLLKDDWPRTIDDL